VRKVLRTPRVVPSDLSLADLAELLYISSEDYGYLRGVRC
jgi:hypothetical protein